jgi:chloramphenicol 3-O phosphotransferase
MSKIIFLNGCSSAGKTSLVKAIQHLNEEPWLTFGIDTFFKALSPKYLPGGKKAEEGIQFVPGVDQEGFPIMEVKGGSYAKKISASAPKMIKQLADDGHNLIIDEVIWEKKDLENYASTLKSYQVCYVKVNCELPLMEEREILRSDRSLGLARTQFAKMKDLVWDSYDMEVDTSYTSSFTNAKKILEFYLNKKQNSSTGKI